MSIFKICSIESSGVFIFTEIIPNNTMLAKRKPNKHKKPKNLNVFKDRLDIPKTRLFHFELVKSDVQHEAK